MRKALFNSNGSLNKGALIKMNVANTLFAAFAGSGRGINRNMMQGLEAVIRIETGAVVTEAKG